MISFKGRHHKQEIILQCVRWYVAYSLSYRDLEELMQERGYAVDHSSIQRWVVYFAPRIEKALASSSGEHALIDDKLDNFIQPLLLLEVGEHIGRIWPHPPGVFIHDVEVGTDIGRQVNFVDD